MHRISWNLIEPIKNNYNNFPTYIDPIFAGLPLLQDISLNLIEEPCYILGLTNPTTKTWCDTAVTAGSNQACTGFTCSTGGIGGYSRAVPWDGNLWSRRESYIYRLAKYLHDNSDLSHVSIINTNLPGGDSGIRNADGQPFSATQGPPNYTTMQDYSRPALLGAIQHELRTVQDVFLQQYSAPILIQIGFFTQATDDLGPPPPLGGCTGPNCGTYSDELWQWLYKEAGDFTKGPNKDLNGNPMVSLYDEFNGVIRPRVAFFQEDLAAARNDIPLAPPHPGSPYANYVTWPLSTAYTFTPNMPQMPTFSYWPSQSAAIYNNAIVFQANCPWTSAFASDDGDKFYHTFNGTPNDGMEAAFNAYLNEYLEIYPPDIDEAQPQAGSATLDATLWASELQSWHDYYKDQRDLCPRATEAPAGVNATYANGGTQLNVSFYAMYGADTYTVSTRALNTTPAVWSDASVCTPSGCTVPLMQGPLTATNPYLVRVQGKNSTTNKSSALANAAIFLSESSNDGYVIRLGNTSNYSVGTQTGIRAGEGSGGQLPHWRGILSFNTSALSSVTTSVLGARLRLHQTSSGGNFDPTNNPCLVDVDKGSFGGDPGIAGTDYNATGSTITPNAFNILNMAGMNGGWFERVFPQTLATSYVDIAAGPNDRTQFRIHFQSFLGAGHYESWDDGESTSSPPQLIVQY